MKLVGRPRAARALYLRVVGIGLQMGVKTISLDEVDQSGSL